MATAAPDAPSTGGPRGGALTPWRRVRTGLAAALVVVGALWLGLIFLGPWGPLTANFLTPILVLVFLVWVMLDALVREMTKRAGLRGRE